MTVKSIRLADVAQDRGLVGGPFGSSLLSKDYVSTGVPVVRGANIGRGRFLQGPFAHVTSDKVARDLERNTAEPGDLVFTQRGTLGGVALVPGEPPSKYVVSQSQMRLRVNPVTTHAEFVYYACSTANFRRQITDRAISTGVPHINLSILGDLVIPDMPLLQQQAIAEVMGALDDKIAVNEMFRATAGELLRHAYVLAASRGAREKGFLTAISVEYGEAFKGQHFSRPGEGRPLIRIRDLRTSRPQTWTVEERRSESVVRRGDVLVGMDAEFRPMAWVGDEGVLNQRVCRMSSTSAGQAYVREAIKSPLAHIESYKTGTTVSHLNKSDLVSAKVLMLPHDAQQAFSDRYDPVYQAEVAAAYENQALTALRDTLLPALMSGKLRVRDAEKTVQEVL